MADVVETIDDTPWNKPLMGAVGSATRGPMGTGAERPFQTHPSYPRLAKPMTKENRVWHGDEMKWIDNIGKYYFWLAMLMVACYFIFYIMPSHKYPEEYHLPPPTYLYDAYQRHLKIRWVVYLDVAINGHKLGRIHIGLFDQHAPYFTENFYRLCSGQNPDGETMRGSLFWKCTGWNLYGGDFKGVDGFDGKCVIPEFMDDGYLPEDQHNLYAWPFACYTGGGFNHHENNFNDSNFCISLGEMWPVTHGDFTTFGMVVEGYEIVEAMSKAPKEPFPYFVDRLEVVDCGLSEYNGDEQTINELLRRYHGARCRRYVATSDTHRVQYQQRQEEREKKRLVKAKQAELQQSLREAQELALTELQQKQTGATWGAKGGLQRAGEMRSAPEDAPLMPAGFNQRVQFDAEDPKYAALAHLQPPAAGGYRQQPHPGASAQAQEVVYGERQP